VGRWSERAGRRGGERRKKQRETERDRDTERQRDRETERQRDRETERQRDRERKRQTDRQTDRETDRETGPSSKADKARIAIIDAGVRGMWNVWRERETKQPTRVRETLLHLAERTLRPPEGDSVSATEAEEEEEEEEGEVGEAVPLAEMRSRLKASRSWSVDTAAGAARLNSGDSWCREGVLVCAECVVVECVCVRECGRVRRDDRGGDRQRDGETKAERRYGRGERVRVGSVERRRYGIVQVWRPLHKTLRPPVPRLPALTLMIRV
jgi:hypothetical protein